MPRFCCTVCGVEFSYGGGVFWQGNAHYVIPNVPEIPVGQKSSLTPFLSNKLRLGGRESDPEAQVLDPDSGEYSIAAFDTFPPLRPVRAAGRPFGYPIHESCWKILKLMLYNASEADDIKLKTNVLHNIFSNTSYRPYTLQWPHEYYQFDDYYSPTWADSPERASVEDDPMQDDFLYTIHEYKETGLSTAFGSVPSILPLPLELVEYIYCYLDWHDIERLRQIRTTRAIELPKSYWKSFVAAKGEFGYVYLTHLRIFHPFSNWYEAFQLAKKFSEKFEEDIINRKRVWKICKDLAEQVTDIATCESAGLEPITEVPSDRRLATSLFPPDDCTVVVHGESLITPPRQNRRLFTGTTALYEGKISCSKSEILVVYYSGSGSLSFVSGISILPEGRRLGYITSKQRMIYLSGNILSVAYSKHGVVDLSISKDVNAPRWRFDNDLQERKAAVKYGIFDSSKSNEIRVKAKWDACRMVALWIDFPEKIESTSTDNQAEFVQKYAWLTKVPSLGLNLNIHTYMGDTEQTERTFRPLQHVVFPPATALTLITCWVNGANELVSGLSFHFENPHENLPLTLGTNEDAVALDFPINGPAGENITAVSLLVGNGNEDSFSGYIGCVNGLVIETSMGRNALLASRKLSCFDISRFQPSSGSRVTGFYGKAAMRRYSSYILSLGVMTSQDKMERQDRPLAYFSDLYFDTPWPSDMPSNLDDPAARTALDGGQYANRAPLEDCSQITYYLHKVHKWRITGLRIDYRTGSARDGKPRIFGQISPLVCWPVDSNVLVLDDGEYLTSVVAYCPHCYMHPHVCRAISCIKFEMSSGRSVVWGEESKYLLKKGVRLGHTSSLRWDFADGIDCVRIEKEGEEGIETL